MRILQVLLDDDRGRLQLVFFNQPYMKKLLANGRELLASGEVALFRGQMQMASPEIEVLDESEYQDAQAPGIVPVYPLTKGIRQRWLRGRVASLLERDDLMAELEEILPESWLRKSGWPSRREAFRQIHFPESAEAAELALDRFKFEEAFLLQLLGALNRHRNRREKGPVAPAASKLLDRFLAGLPFTLTGAQAKAMDEVLGDMRQGYRMNRLLQGDVGSGKTVVALAAFLPFIEMGMQGAFMVPIEILAVQHFKKWGPTLKALGVRCALLTGSTPAKERRELLTRLAEGDIHLIFGTHALIQDDIRFHNLGLAVVDEQHRFGVMQRASFHEQGKPHVLVMSATPIPRSMAMTLYGDLDLSIIDEIPPGRPPVLSRLVPEAKRGEVFNWLKERVAEDERAFLIFPLVEESDKLELGAATEEYEALRDGEFKDISCELLHGRMNGARKAEIMERFASGETRILVATTVIEVGIDVPEATVMLIHNPERFGLSQLHQLRGRIGRGSLKSYCLLILPDELGEGARTRLNLFVAHRDGFKLAEEDLKTRGPGDLFGVRQHGSPDLRLVHPLNDAALVAEARERAQQLVEADPELLAPDLRALRNLLRRLFMDRLLLSGVG
jgi:ATP-dependent DNA helicase RecG